MELPFDLFKGETEATLFHWKISGFFIARLFVLDL